MKAIGVGLWGIGRSGFGMHLKEIKMYPGKFTVKGCCDLIPERMELVRKDFPACRAYPDFHDLLADPEVELVVVALRSPDHTRAGIAALDAGKMVMVDKPIALNYSEALRLKAAVEKHPGKLFFRQTLRTEKVFQHVREIIASGILGTVFEIKLRRQGYYRRCDWQSLRSCGGGILNNWGPHLIDHALQFMDYQVASVWADLKKLTASGDAEDHFHALLKSPSGLVVDIAVSGAVALPEPEYSVYGDRGSLLSVNMKELKLKYLDPEKTSPPPAPSPETLPVNAPYRPSDGLVWIAKTIPVHPALKVSEYDTYLHLYESIRNHKPYNINPDGAFENVRISDLIRQFGNSQF